jgi:hypothetical protein
MLSKNPSGQVEALTGTNSTPSARRRIETLRPSNLSSFGILTACDRQFVNNVIVLAGICRLRGNGSICRSCVSSQVARVSTSLAFHVVQGCTSLRMASSVATLRNSGLIPDNSLFLPTSRQVRQNFRLKKPKPLSSLGAFGPLSLQILLSVADFSV